jgi:plasmid stability protein
MPDILIRGLNPKTVSRLKERARRHGRSLQGEAKLLLEQAAGADREAIAAMFDQWKTKLAGRKLSSSVASIREDRAR